MRRTMRSDDCIHEETVRRAAVDHRELDADLTAHVGSCAVCRETQRVADRLRGLAEAGPSPRLPAAGQLWWRAEIVRRLNEPERRREQAARPIKWGLGVGGMAVLTGLLLIAVFIIDQLRASLASLSFEVSTSWLAVGLGALVLPLVALVVFLFLIGQDA